MKIEYVCAFIVVMSSASLAMFGCQSESCIQDLTSMNWTCHFENCSVFPVNITNVTVLNMTNITVMNTTVEYNITVLNQTVNITQVVLTCDNNTAISWIGQKLDNLSVNIDCLVPYESCKESKKNALFELTTCNDKLVIDYLPRNITEQRIYSLNYNVTTLSNDLKECNDSRIFYFVFGGIVVGLVIWYFKFRRPSYDQNTVRPSGGNVSFNPERINRKNEVLDLKNQIEELKQNLKTKKK